jgi:CO/xanthine dehydrogenase FAD-binding subunit
VNASPAADGVPALMAYDAVVELVSAREAESVALDEFYLGYKQMRRRPDQLISAIRLPRRKYDFAYFEKVGARRAQTITKVGVAITHSAVGWRVVANSVAPVVLRCRTVEGMLEAGAGFASADEVVAALRGDVAPIDDIRSTAEYRLRVLGNLIFHAIQK